MVSTPTMVGALLGLGVQLYSNAVRKLPLMRNPWEHVIGIGVGVWAANGIVQFEERMAIDVEKTLEDAKAAQKRRFIGTMRTEE